MTMVPAAPESDAPHHQARAPRWEQAHEEASRLNQTQKDVLYLLLRLPLLYTGHPEPILSLMPHRSHSHLLQSLAALAQRGLVALTWHPTLPWRVSSMYYLTDLGLAVEGVLSGYDVGQLAEVMRCRRVDLEAKRRQLSRVVGEYAMLGAVARTIGDRPSVLGWERPFRGRDPARDASGHTLPPVMEFASAARLRAAGGSPQEYVLVADFGELPIGFYRREVLSLLRYAARHGSSPVLVVGSDRPDTWETHLLGWAQKEGLVVRVPRLMVSREEVEAGHLHNHAAMLAALDAYARRCGSPWPLHLSSRRIDRAQPPPSGPAPTRVREGLPSSPQLREQSIALLGLVGGHIWLTVEEAAIALSMEVKSVRKARAQLLVAGYIRDLEPDEVVEETGLGETVFARDLPGYEPQARLMEMTRDGLEAYALLGSVPPLSERNRHDERRPSDLVYLFGLSGGGPDKEHFFGAREKLTLELAHTRGISWLGLEFHRAAARAPVPVRIAAWYSTREATRKTFRPDGYVRFWWGETQVAYFLEYDRAKERAPELSGKYQTWREFISSGAAVREYGRFYPVLFVTMTAAQERLILRTALEEGEKMGTPLPMLTTTTSLVAQARSLGVFAPIWRTLHGEERVTCLPRLPAAPAPPGTHAPRHTSSSSSSYAAARATSLPTPDLQTRLAEVRAASAAPRTGSRDT